MPSKARPDQVGEETTGSLSSTKLHQAADNATAIPRRDEVATAAEGEVPEDIRSSSAAAPAARSAERGTRVNLTTPKLHLPPSGADHIGLRTRRNTGEFEPGEEQFTVESESLTMFQGRCNEGQHVEYIVH
ncbi:hypothetical protein CONLIGDRAFT_685920 [Coniochaeta ligniaria NRRL 30616]|uniref:Uncharacterized protein n=1 Tax=Coniochaeta ligniaria NRRL 30616 TaxID=1408157 RepID=A0A1J7IA20_9PEZI|nr:hypothetical protein CONLIGDRAFT_685920 [Coniochaeta ligniaria NRRL 30616]